MENIDEEEEVVGNNDDNDEAYDDGIDFDDGENNENAVESETPPTNAKKITAKLVDNKRKMLENNLSASQRDQAYLNMAKDDLQVKQNLVNQLAEATRETNKAFGQISESIVSVGNFIGNGLALFARALGGSQQNNNSSYFNHHSSNAMHANPGSNAMHTNFPYGTSPMQGNNVMHGFRNSYTPSRSFSSSYSGDSQVASSSYESLNNPIMENNKTYEQLYVKYTFYYVKHMLF